jgi:probable F420-dependent oxidoreductase
VKVRIGIGLGQASDEGAETALAAIDRHGFDSLWVSEVLTSPAPDPLLTLAALAGAYPRRRLGATLVLPGRNPVRLAKSLATLDRMTGGRLLLAFVPGLAHGVERDAVGVPVPERGRAMDEALPKLRRWWAGQEVDGIRVEPRPRQDPLEPWLAGLAPASLRRCGRYADGWLGAFCTVDEAVTAKRRIDEAAAAAGREVDPEHFGMSIGYAHTEPEGARLATIAARTAARGVDPRDVLPVGTAELRGRLEAFVERGISKFVLRPVDPRGGWDEELGALAAAVGDLQT